MHDGTATVASVSVVSAEALLRGCPALVLAPHPDDESLGCGALLAAAFAGPGAHVVCLTDGAASHPGSREVPPVAMAALRRAELLDAIAILGGTARDVTLFDVPDTRLVPTHALAERLGDIARRQNSGLLLAPSPLDPHCDHVAAATLAQTLAATRPHLRLAYYPVWSRWRGEGAPPQPEGTSTCRLPLGRFRQLKAAAISAHRSQAGEVVTDDPSGFEMPPGFAAMFAGMDEVYFLAWAGGVV